MAAPLTDDERARILELAEQGLTCTAIAEAVGRSPSAVSRACKAVGHRFGTQAREAWAAREAYSVDRRAELAERAIETAHQLLEAGVAPVDGPTMAVVTAAGKVVHGVPLSPRDEQARTNAISTLARAALELQRATQADEGLSAFDAWLRDVIGGGRPEATL